METNCTICDKVKETRYLDLFVTGSEGTRLCHECEMLVVEFIRSEQRAKSGLVIKRKNTNAT